MADPSAGADQGIKKEIYTHEAPWLIYSMSWSVRPDHFRLALGSFSEDYTNRVQIVRLNEQRGAFDVTAEFDHPYPATKLMWQPDKTGSRPDLLASSADYLRVWENTDDGVKLKALLNNVRCSSFRRSLAENFQNMLLPL
jgi:DDB1- and CUL4-associated factor 7